MSDSKCGRVRRKISPPERHADYVDDDDDDDDYRTSDDTAEVLEDAKTESDLDQEHLMTCRTQPGDMTSLHIPAGSNSQECTAVCGVGRLTKTRNSKRCIKSNKILRLGRLVIDNVKTGSKHDKKNKSKNCNKNDNRRNDNCENTNNFIDNNSLNTSGVYPRSISESTAISGGCLEAGQSTARSGECLEGGELVTRSGGCLVGGRVLLRQWLVQNVEAECFPGMHWYNSDKTQIRIPWKHGSRTGWTVEDCQVFKAWANHTGRWRGAYCDVIQVDGGVYCDVI